MAGPLKIGYARVSTLDQEAGLDEQLKKLEEAGCLPRYIYKEQVSSVGKRPELEAALSKIREGDQLVVTKLDRLARSVKHLGEIVDRLKDEGASLLVLNMQIDTSTATGKLMLNMLGSVAEFEREMMLERQREGIAKAQAEGKYKGRKATAQAKAEDVQRLDKEGVGPSEIARRLSIGRSSVYRILNEKGS